MSEDQNDVQKTEWPQGPGWSPDGGRYWIKGHFIYWHTGHVGDLRDGAVFRVMPGGYQHDEDYSAWTDEHRAQVRKEWEERRDAAKAEAEAAEKIRQGHLASARAKLTDEEWHAVVEEGRC